MNKLTDEEQEKIAEECWQDMMLLHYEEEKQQEEINNVED